MLLLVTVSKSPTKSLPAPTQGQEWLVHQKLANANRPIDIKKVLPLESVIYKWNVFVRILHILEQPAKKN